MGIQAALGALGSPEELASEYFTDNLLARAEVSRSPLKILRSLFRWATLSVAGFFVLLGSTVGYFFGIVFVLVAIAKLFHPRTAGLWTYPSGDGGVEFSFRLGFGNPPVGGHDVLGWWIIPIGWIAGGALMMLTTSIAVWFVRPIPQISHASINRISEDRRHEEKQMDAPGNVPEAPTSSKAGSPSQPRRLTPAQRWISLAEFAMARQL